MANYTRSLLCWKGQEGKGRQAIDSIPFSHCSSKRDPKIMIHTKRIIAPLGRFRSEAMQCSQPLAFNSFGFQVMFVSNIYKQAYANVQCTAASISSFSLLICNANFYPKYPSPALFGWVEPRLITIHCSKWAGPPGMARVLKPPWSSMQAFGCARGRRVTQLTWAAYKLFSSSAAASASFGIRGWARRAEDEYQLNRNN